MAAEQQLSFCCATEITDEGWCQEDALVNAVPQAGRGPHHTSSLHLYERRLGATTTGRGGKRFESSAPLEENGCRVIVWTQLQHQVNEKLLGCSNTEGAAEEETLGVREVLEQRGCLMNEAFLRFAGTRRGHRGAADASCASPQRHANGAFLLQDLIASRANMNTA